MGVYSAIRVASPFYSEKPFELKHLTNKELALDCSYRNGLIYSTKRILYSSAGNRELYAICELLWQEPEGDGCSSFLSYPALKQTTNGCNFLWRAVYRWVRNFGCLAHNDEDMYVVQYIHGNQAPNHVLILSAPACNGVHLSKPLDS